MRNILARPHQNAATRITTIKASISIPQHDGSLSETRTDALIHVVSYVKDVGYIVQCMLWTMFMNCLTVLTHSIQIICNHSVLSVITVRRVMRLRNVLDVKKVRCCLIFDVTLLPGILKSAVTLLPGILKNAVTLLVGVNRNHFFNRFLKNSYKSMT